MVERVPDSVFAPDLMVYSDNRPDAPSHWFVTRPPQLVVEVLDESDTSGGMWSKAERYFSAGVSLVWLVNTVHESVAPLTRHGRYAEFTGQEELAGNGVLPDFTCKVADLFTLPGQQPTSPPTA